MAYKQVNLYGQEEMVHTPGQKKKREKTMNRARAIKQLKEIIEDRQIFDDGTEDTEVFRRDIEALKIAIDAIEFLEGGKSE